MIISVHPFKYVQASMRKQKVSSQFAVWMSYIFTRHEQDRVIRFLPELPSPNTTTAPPRLLWTRVRMALSGSGIIQLCLLGIQDQILQKKNVLCLKIYELKMFLKDTSSFRFTTKSCYKFSEL